MKRISGVYVLSARNGFYKIGASSDIRQRIKNFGIKLPFDISLFTYIKLPEHKIYYYEKWLHNYFFDMRANGEWFILDYYSLKLLAEYITDEGELDNLIWHDGINSELEYNEVLPKQLDYMLYRGPLIKNIEWLPEKQLIELRDEITTEICRRLEELDEH